MTHIEQPYRFVLEKEYTTVILTLLGRELEKCARLSLLYKIAQKLTEIPNSYLPPITIKNLITSKNSYAIHQ